MPWIAEMMQPKNRDSLGAFFKCPRGHRIPHRVKGKGRCAPFDCCETKKGAHGAVRAADKADAAESLEYAEATMELKGMSNMMRAWDEAHPVPVLPPPPKTSSVREYMEKRLEQVAPLSLERRIRKLVLDPGHGGDTAARELLNRGGYGERPEVRATFQGPVLIVNITADQMKSESPYASQGKLPSHTQGVSDEIDGEVVDEHSAGDAAADDAGSAPGDVAEGEGEVG